MKTSKVYKRRNHSFRYDYDNGLVSWISKATKEEIEENEQWKDKYGNGGLWDIDKDGYIEIQSVGLMKSNWEHKDIRDSYLDQWIDELEEETKVLSEQFLLWG